MSFSFEHPAKAEWVEFNSIFSVRGSVIEAKLAPCIRLFPSFVLIHKHIKTRARCLVDWQAAWAVLASWKPARQKHPADESERKGEREASTVSFNLLGRKLRRSVNSFRFSPFKMAEEPNFAFSSSLASSYSYFFLRTNGKERSLAQRKEFVFITEKPSSTRRNFSASNFAMKRYSQLRHICENWLMCEI